MRDVVRAADFLGLAAAQKKIGVRIMLFEEMKQTLGDLKHRLDVIREYL